MTPDVVKTIGEYKAGKVEFRNDKGGNVQAIVGKLSFEPQKLVENIQSFIDTIIGNEAIGRERNLPSLGPHQRHDEPQCEVSHLAIRFRRIPSSNTVIP